MSQMVLNTTLNDANVSIEFDWYGEEPDWESMEVFAWLPAWSVDKKRSWPRQMEMSVVKINDVLSDHDWIKIEEQIYLNEDKLKREALENEY
jgi:hypothetical protein